MADPLKWYACIQQCIPPKGMEGFILPIDRWHNGSDSNGGTVSVTCWQLTPEELAEVIKSGGKVFVATLTKLHPAMYVGTEDSVRTLCVDYGPVWKKEKIDGNQD